MTIIMLKYKVYIIWIYTECTYIYIYIYVYIYYNISV